MNTPSDTSNIKPPQAETLNLNRVLKIGKFPYKKKLKRKVYEQQMSELAVELIKLQAWVRGTGQRVVILFEGPDAKLKQSAIECFMRHFYARDARVVRLGPTSTLERRDWYFQRFIQHLPSSGEIVLFDRSWYELSDLAPLPNGAELLAFSRQTPELERMLARSGILLFKYYFREAGNKAVKSAQKKAVKKVNKKHPKRIADPAAVIATACEPEVSIKEALLFYTDSDGVPWTLLKSDDGRRACLNCVWDFLSDLNYRGKGNGINADPLIDGRCIWR